MPRLALIGASGFVGTRLIDLLAPKYKLINFDKQQSKKYPLLTQIVDIRDKQAIQQCLKGFDCVVLLAAEHRDDVSPASLYYEVNVDGAKNVLEAMEFNDVRSIVFTSSVAVYGLNKSNPDELHPTDPFNHYGKSKWQAEEVLRMWQANDPLKRNLSIVRPTVIFGERNRGNVYNLLKQIASGKFMKIGKCSNKKSMSYVGNVTAFIEYLIDKSKLPGYHLYNYVDKPDLTMNELINVVGRSLDKKVSSLRVPYFLGMLGGYGCDALSWITQRKLPVSSIRVKKFCATTQFDASQAHLSGFTPSYTLEQGLSKTIQFEFINEAKDDIIYVSE